MTTNKIILSEELVKYGGTLFLPVKSNVKNKYDLCEGDELNVEIHSIKRSKKKR
tara:strand:- start:1545 stop:1706 length:162 start_codon:yes stop_codon:yes gene_type:complete